MLKESKSASVHHLTDPDWLSELAYLACIFESLNKLNLSIQGPNTNILTMNEKRYYEMFPELDGNLEKSGQSHGNLKIHITGHLHGLLEQFHKYFPKEMQAELYDWIQHPFTKTRN